MSWTQLADIKQQLNHLWVRGELLRPICSATTQEPIPLRLMSPSSKQITEQFEQVRAWVAQLQQINGLIIDWQEINHRVQGRQMLPQALRINLPDAWRLIGKQADARLFNSVLQQTQHYPQLLTSLAQKPLLALEYAAVWPQLLQVIDWFVAHPQAGIYLRQIDLPGIHSKFIEAHRSILSSLLERVLPVEQIRPEYTGVTGFALRYGCQDKPLRIRFRALDTQICPLGTGADITLDVTNFAALQQLPAQVWLTENEINFLSFPAQKQAWCIFGAGYGWEALAQAQWLQQVQLFYWGDIDTHGFAILDSLRTYFPHARSVLMDEATFLAHRPFWEQEPKPVMHTLNHLTDDEQALFQALQHHTWGTRLRLEQERVQFAWLQQALSAC